MITRGCGNRQKGGVYAECATSPFGRPIEDFLIDPPRILTNAEQIACGIMSVGGKKSYRGVRLLEQGGVAHILDVVGAEYYQNVADYVEETLRFGASRRCEGINYARLTPESRILLAHPKAHIYNSEPYFRHWINVTTHSKTYAPCPKDFESHRMCVAANGDCKDFQMCAGIWYNDITGGKPMTPNSRVVSRKMPAFNYLAVARPEGVEPAYQLAIFMSLPITRIACVKAETEEFKAKVERARKSTLPVEEVTE